MEISAFFSDNVYCNEGWLQIIFGGKGYEKKDFFCNNHFGDGSFILRF